MAEKPTYRELVDALSDAIGVAEGFHDLLESLEDEGTCDGKCAEMKAVAKCKAVRDAATKEGE